MTACVSSKTSDGHKPGSDKALSGGAGGARPVGASKGAGITTVHIPVALYGLGVESHAGLGVIALAWSFDRTGGLRASNNTLAQVFHMHRQNIIRVVNKLRGEKLVEVEQVANGRVIRVTAKIRRLLAGLQPETTPSLQVETPSLRPETSASLQPETKVVSDLRPKGKGSKRERKGRTRTPRFVPPTVEQVADYATTQGYPDFDAEWFVKYYSELDWHSTKGKPVVNWKLTVLTWIRRDEKDGKISKLELQRGDPGWLPSAEEVIASYEEEDD